MLVTGGVKSEGSEGRSISAGAGAGLEQRLLDEPESI